MQPLLSIVVPTKDRYKYLKSLILLISDFNVSNIELVIQDNTVENFEILDFIESKFDFIKYFHTKEQISISQNSDLAILNSCGKYVCFLGDDDGITRNILSAVDWMERNNVEVVVPTEISYFWPDFVNSITGTLSGSLSYKKIEFNAIQLNPLVTLEQIMSKGFINRGLLPLVYHGIVRRDTLNKIYDIGGTFFPGASPDIANGVALSLICTKYFKIDFPIIISGASRSHGAGIRKMKGRVADLDTLPFLPVGTKNNWEEEIPLIWTGETIWADSAIKALKYMGRKNLIHKVNFEYLLAWFSCMNPSLWRMGYNLSKNKLFFIFRSSFFILKRLILAINRKITMKLFNYNDGQIIIKGLNDIRDAEKDLMIKYPNFTIKPTY